ncbi:PDR/VanB family oxidoreductase [Oryzibacter oryziterrae]|uniref:PDR/VanB family oxidoreductase n=1 Tax=Oryzibacter oryziterrae TaxID=2766474 RepID=UPI001F2622B1|nr:PDR/VanB family oxidoreductase [Oryzibacter oryziterrae]
MQSHLDWRDARLLSTVDLSADVRLFAIEPSADFRPPTPGSHIQVLVSIGDRQESRCYSTVGPSSDGVYRIAVKRLATSRGGSAFMWTLEAGSTLRIALPRNHFELKRNRPAYLLLAGGIGITPIHSMALALAGAGADFRMLYAARSAADHVLADETRAVIGDRLATFADDHGERVDLDAEIAALPQGGEFYVCGPIGLMDAARQAWARAGRPATQVRMETFGNSGRLVTAPFEVAIPRLDRAITVDATETLLEALERSGVAMISDCRKGECGLCALPILDADGEVDHRDVFFSDEEKAEGARLCTCVSRFSGSRLVLDTPDRIAP